MGDGGGGMVGRGRARDGGGGSFIVGPYRIIVVLVSRRGGGE